MKILDLKQLEVVCKLVRKYKLKEVNLENCSIVYDPILDVPVAKRKSRKLREQVQEVIDRDYLDKHLETLPDEPWLSVTDSQLDNFDVKGKVS